MKKDYKKPSAAGILLLRYLLNGNGKYGFMGDLEEIYNIKLKQSSRFKAEIWFWKQMIILFPTIIQDKTYWSFTMFKNYFKVAVRNLRKHSGYSFINLSGLAIGLACFMLIFLWIRNELSYDKFHENGDRIYRLNTANINDSGSINNASSYALGPALIEKYPEIEEHSRVWYWHFGIVKYKDKSFYEKKFYLADPSFFSMFTFTFLKGSPETSLNGLNSIVLTEETAARYFGIEDPVGKTLRFNDTNDFTVTGIIKNVPRNSHMQFDMISRVEHLGRQRLESWENTGASYVLLNKNADKVSMNKKLERFFIDYVNPESIRKPYLQNMTEIHLNKLGRPDGIRYIYIFSVVAIFILTIACINFMNLTTAKAGGRAKEVGMRKVVGAGRADLIKQFFGESVLLAAFASVIAFGIVLFTLPWFNTLTGKELNLFDKSNYSFFLIAAGAALLTGLISGSYPALLLSSFQPVKIIKGIRPNGSKSYPFRKILVIFQFSISIFLIITTSIVYNQLDFIQNKDIGYNRNNIVTIRMNSELSSNYETYKNELLKNTDIVNVTASASKPVNVGQGIAINWEGNENPDPVGMRYTMADYDYFKTFDMKIVKGRSFSKEFPSDETEAYIINESALEVMNLENPIGTRITFAEGLPQYYHEGKIIGVVKDFHVRSLHEQTVPFVMRIYKPWYLFIFVKIKPGNVPETISLIKNTTWKFSSGLTFEYSFLDDAFNELYKSEMLMGKLFSVFAFLAIFIACLGLLGLASYTAEKRTKEIGIRKVLGATVSEVVLMLSKDYIKWVVFAGLIAWPSAYFIMKSWLSNFAYQTGIGILTFIFSGFITLLLALATVSFQALKAAGTNPANSLKHE